MNFDEVYQLADKSGSESAFNRDECVALYFLSYLVPPGGLAIEIGLQFGRSTTVIGAIAKEKNFSFMGIDDWKEDVSPDAKRNIEELLIKQMGLPIKLVNSNSKIAWRDIPQIVYGIDLIHIDGDHNYKGVLSDCENYLKYVVKGGFACFDDYGHDSLPGVYKAVSEYMHKHPEWVFAGRFGNKLGVFRKK